MLLNENIYALRLTILVGYTTQLSVNCLTLLGTLQKTAVSVSKNSYVERDTDITIYLSFSACHSLMFSQTNEPIINAYRSLMNLHCSVPEKNVRSTFLFFE